LDLAQKQGSACAWKLTGFPDRKHTEAGPSKLSGRRSGLARESSIGASRVGPLVSGGLAPPPQELAARLERHQVKRPDLNKCTLQATVASHSTPPGSSIRRMDAGVAAVGEVEAESSDAGSALPFDAFYSALFVPLFRSMLLLNGDAAEAEDLTHEAFVRVLERWEAVSRMEAPGAYLFRTALNLERSRLRRMLRRAHRVPREREEQRDFSQEAAERTDVLRILRGLSREQREAIVLIDFLGLNSEEAGRIASVSADALRARLHRARAAIRKELIADE